MASNAPIDENDAKGLIAASSVDGKTPVKLYADPVTHRLLTDAAGGGSGTVTSVSVVTANGFAGTVATATTTPAITISTTVTGILKGDGTTVSAASAGTDYTNLAFKTYSVSGQSDIVADTAEDTFTFVAGTGITLTTNAGTDTLTITASGGGTVPGAPTNSIQYNSSSAFAGSSTLLFNGTDTITFGAENATANLLGKDASSTNTAGGGIFIHAGQGLGSGAGGGVIISSGSGGATGAGTDAELAGGAGGATSGDGGRAFLSGGAATTSGNGGSAVVRAGAAAGSNKNGGSIILATTDKTGAGTKGTVQLLDPTSNINAILSTASLASTDKTFTFPNASGTFALTTGGSLALVVGTTTIGSGTTTRVLFDNAGTLGEYVISGSGNVAMTTSPAFTTPSLGAATATSINGNTFTTGTYTLTGTAGKTLNFTNSLTLSGTDSTTMTFPGTSKTIAANDGSNWTLGSQAIGDLLTASSTTTYTRIAAVAVGQVLVSAGTGTAPAYSANPQVTTIELGAATDTTLSRVSAGVIAVEGVTVDTISAANTLTNKTLTSPIIQTSPVLAAATSLKFTVPSADPSATGITTNEFNSGYTSTAIGDLVYLDSSATWQKADADASAATYSSMLGIALAVAASGVAVNVLLQGFVYAATPFPTFTIGAPIYMSATAGVVTQTAPVTTDSATRIIGYAIHADKMYFNPSNDWITHT